MLLYRSVHAYRVLYTLKAKQSHRFITLVPLHTVALALVNARRGREKYAHDIQPPHSLQSTRVSVHKRAIVLGRSWHNSRTYWRCVPSIPGCSVFRRGRQDYCNSDIAPSMQLASYAGLFAASCCTSCQACVEPSCRCHTSGNQSNIKCVR